jgi:hypothetical protein
MMKSNQKGLGHENWKNKLVLFSLKEVVATKQESE